MAIKAPGYGDSRSANLQDLAVLTGATLISEEAGVKIEDIDLDQLGTAKKITVTKDDTIILDGGGKKEELEERCNVIRSAIAGTTSDYEREKLAERLAKLSGGIAVVKVGGAQGIYQAEEPRSRTGSSDYSRCIEETLPYDCTERWS